MSGLADPGTTVGTFAEAGAPGVAGLAAAGAALGAVAPVRGAIVRGIALSQLLLTRYTSTRRLAAVLPLLVLSVAGRNSPQPAI